MRSQAGSNVSKHRVCTLRRVILTGLHSQLSHGRQGTSLGHISLMPLPTQPILEMALTWKACWGCWGPRPRSEQGCGCRHAGVSVSRSVECGYLDKGETHGLHSVLSASPLPAHCSTPSTLDVLTVLQRRLGAVHRCSGARAVHGCLRAVHGGPSVGGGHATWTLGVTVDTEEERWVSCLPPPSHWSSAGQAINPTLVFSKPRLTRW